MRIARGIAGVFGVGVMAGVAFGGTQPSEILNITGELHGDWFLNTNPAFVPGSQGGHFGLDTLVVSETAPEEVPIPGTNETRPAERWVDLWISVTRTISPDAGPAMIAVDKDVLNGTRTHWTDFHMEIGMGIGPDFAPAPGLEFKLDPPPSEETGRFPNPPMVGPMGDDGAQMAPTELWWLVDSSTPGVGSGETAVFWLGITVPSDKFMPDSTTGTETAMITLRQHWTPTPGGAAVLGLGGLAALRRRRR